MTGVTIWKRHIGVRPKVTVFERLARGKYTLYLRWWDPEKRNWRHKSLSRALRTRSGRIIKTTAKWAIDQAQAKHVELLNASEPAIEPAVTTESEPADVDLPARPETKRVRVVRRPAP